jgi:hypothetical protein
MRSHECGHFWKLKVFLAFLSGKARVQGFDEGGTGKNAINEGSMKPF